MSLKCFVYVVDRDFGFAPNPFHGFCTLATCKPITRRVAKIGDWVIGVGGARTGGKLMRTIGRCIYGMKVTEKMTFDQYWADPRLKIKRARRDGSWVMMVGDNIYQKDQDGNWMQANSHHSHPDGQPNLANMTHDTQTNFVLISNHFFYFGKFAPVIPPNILMSLGYKNGRNHRKFSEAESNDLLKWLRSFKPNYIYDDPFELHKCELRWDIKTKRLVGGPAKKKK